VKSGFALSGRILPRGITEILFRRTDWRGYLDMKPILVVLAAGIGSRYGGLKQMDKIGADGETLLDYAVFDALRSGFDKVVFIIRRAIEQDFKDIVLARMGDEVPSELAFQEQDSLIPPEIFSAVKEIGRTKPWGTAHALLCAEKALDAPFAVLNADDFYGREAYEVMGRYLSGAVTEASIVPYKLEKTLSPMGTVTRGVCTVKNGYLSSVDELLLIKREDDGRIYNTFPDGTKRELAPDTPVSMNFWGFSPSVIPAFHAYFNDFLQARGGELKSECYLPLAADSFIKTGKTAFKVLGADADWFGVTYKEDKETAIQRIEALTAQGIYPKGLWR
jgi:NDP-sugar pyrophosphorylase family protein